MIIVNPSSTLRSKEAQRDPLNESIVMTNFIGEYYNLNLTPFRNQASSNTSGEFIL